MFRTRIILIIVLLTACITGLKAQNDQLSLGLRTGHNAVFGGFAAVSLQGHHDFSCNTFLDAGVQYNTIGRTAAEARSAFFRDYEWGRMSAEILFAYTGLSSVSSFAAGVGAGYKGKHIGLRAGYYYRLYGHQSDMIKEPFNIYYELRGYLLSAVEDWDLDLVVTNNEIFELERHYQPSFIAECRHYPLPELGIIFGLGYKPSGMFNMSADYYQTFLNLGICYRW
jgi:hypothetical protein